MTFNQWRQSHPEAQVKEYGEFREVQINGRVYSADLLFHLEDYRPYDLDEGSIYLVPRQLTAQRSPAQTLDQLFPIDPRD